MDYELFNIKEYPGLKQAYIKLPDPQGQIDKDKRDEILFVELFRRIEKLEAEVEKLREG